MKRALLLLAVVAGLVSCTKFGDTSIRGTFVYDNGKTGSLAIRSSFKFQKSGNVYYESRVGDAPEFTTRGNDLYYRLDGENLTIYHGVKGWKKEIRNTPFRTLTYHVDYLEELDTDGGTALLRYEKQ